MTAGSHAHRKVEKTNRSREIDRNAWAGSQLVLTTWDTIGVGTTLTDLITFGAVFEGQPFFSNGVELQEDETLVDGDYPFVTTGVSEWQTTTQTVNERAQLFYLGARIWISVSSSKAYRLRHRFAFEGTVMRAREHIG